MYEITPLTSIDYAAVGKLAKLQNAKFLLSTVINSCPMDRTFGIDPPLDETTEYAKTSMAATIIESLERTIQGLSVLEVTFIDTPELNSIVPVVKVVIEDDEV